MSTNGTHCSVPNFDRLNYFYGQTLGVRDFVAEQAYFREKLKLHNRCLHGPGVVCGLIVQPIGSTPENPKLAPAGQPCWPRVRIDCGMALDADGNELIVRDPLCVDISDCLSKEDRDYFAAETLDKPLTLYLSVCFREQPIEPIRPILPEGCGNGGMRQYSKVRDAICVRVSRTCPSDDRCDPCCEPYTPAAPSGVSSACQIEGPPILLARLVFTRDAASCTANNSVRPLVGRRATTIDGINWVQGGEYEPDEADKLSHHGLRIHFSRAIRPESLQPGVVDVLLYMGGGTIRGDIKYLAAHVKPEFVHDGKPHGLSIHVGKKERASPGDRIHVVLRSAFILDECCRPIDGLHVGGWVGFHTSKGDDVKHPLHANVAGCEAWRGPQGRAESGTGFPGGNFEGWFFVSESDERRGKY